MPGGVGGARRGKARRPYPDSGADSRGGLVRPEPSAGLGKTRSAVAFGDCIANDGEVVVWSAAT